MTWLDRRGIDHPVKLVSWYYSILNKCQCMLFIREAEGSRCPTQAVPCTTEWRLAFRRNRATVNDTWEVVTWKRKRKAIAVVPLSWLLWERHNLRSGSQATYLPSWKEFSQLQSNLFVYCEQPSSTCADMVQPRLGWDSEVALTRRLDSFPPIGTQNKAGLPTQNLPFARVPAEKRAKAIMRYSSLSPKKWVSNFSWHLLHASAGQYGTLIPYLLFKTCC